VSVQAFDYCSDRVRSKRHRQAPLTANRRLAGLATPTILSTLSYTRKGGYWFGGGTVRSDAGRRVLKQRRTVPKTPLNLLRLGET